MENLSMFGEKLKELSNKYHLESISLGSENLYLVFYQDYSALNYKSDDEIVNKVATTLNVDPIDLIATYDNNKDGSRFLNIMAKIL